MDHTTALNSAKGDVQSFLSTNGTLLLQVAVVALLVWQLFRWIREWYWGGIPEEDRGR